MTVKRELVDFDYWLDETCHFVGYTPSEGTSRTEWTEIRTSLVEKILSTVPLHSPPPGFRAVAHWDQMDVVWSVLNSTCQGLVQL